MTDYCRSCEDMKINLLYLLFFILWRYNLHIILCNFKVYNMLTDTFIFCNMTATVALANTFITSHNYHLFNAENIKI